MAQTDGLPAESKARVTELFLHDGNRLTEEQVSVFDDVLCQIIERVKKTALAELGKRLAPVDNAPIEVVRPLAKDEEISVAAPILTESRRLPASDLIEIGSDKRPSASFGDLFQNALRGSD